MSARRFRLELAGQILVGLAFRDEGELESWLLGRGLAVPVEQPQAIAVAAEDPRAGRPSFDGVIAAAVAALGERLARCPTLSARARLVRAQIADQGSTDAAPSRRTIEIYLARHF